jgi:hypothetical protein
LAVAKKLYVGTNLVAGTDTTSPILYGSSSASGNLEITSTSNASKGTINFGASGALGSITSAGAWTLGKTSTTTSPVAIKGTGQLSTSSFDTFGNLGGSVSLAADGSFVGSGGALIFSESSTPTGYAAIKGSLTTGANNSAGQIIFFTRLVNTDATLTNVGSIANTGAWTFGATSASTTHTFQSGGATKISLQTAAANQNTIELSRTVNTPQLWQIYQPSSSTDLRFYSATGSGTATADVGIVTTAGVWTFGNSTASGSSVYTHQFTSAARTYLRIAGNGTDKNATLQLYGTGSSGSGVEFYGGTGTGTSAGTARWLNNYVGTNAGSGSETGVTANSLYWYSYGPGTVVGQIDYATGAWTFGATSGTVKHTINRKLGFELETDSSTSTPRNALAPNTAAMALTGAAAITLNGIAAGAEGQIFYLTNTTGNTLTVNHNSGSASAADRILTKAGANISVGSNEQMMFIYAGARWRMMY